MLDPAPGLAVFGAELVADLGARVDGHWRVRLADGRDAVLRRWGHETTDPTWELALVERLHALGWPTPVLLADPVELDGALWTLHRLLPGTQRTERGPEEQRDLGRLIARTHLDLATLDDLPQRRGWRTALEILDDPSLDALFSANAARWPDDMRVLRAHLDRARLRVEEIGPLPTATIPVHGDATTGNVLWVGGRATGILDFELAHRDLRIAEFALSWRGKYDDVVGGYEEIAPLSAEERALIGPVFWTRVINGGAELLARGQWDREDGWIRRMLDRRSPLLGPDADGVISAAG